LAVEGTGLLWQGDFNNARHLLQAMARRADKPRQPRLSKAQAQLNQAAQLQPGYAFHQHRQAQSQRAQVLSMLLVGLQADHSVALKRAPDVRAACEQAFGVRADEPPAGSGQVGIHRVVSLRELLGVVSAFEWRKNGVPVPALGPPPNNRIYPHYGVFSPVRGEYVALVAQAPLPAALHSNSHALDIGTGTGVLAAVLARRGVQHVLATDTDPRALACAQDNLSRLGVAQQVRLLQADLFGDLVTDVHPYQKLALVVCNPPWVPASAGSALERAVYDEDSRMLLGFLNGLAAHLAPGGEGWLILSDLAEHLGLRTRAMLLAAFQAANLQVLGRLDARPMHPKAQDSTDPLHQSRAAEVTSLWRLGVARSPNA
jgi:SAM-dependent methyltransferase